MNPLSQALLTGLMLRFGFLSRAEIDATWLAMVERLGAERASQHIEGVIATTLDALPEGCPNDLAGKAIAGAIKAIMGEWESRIEPLLKSMPEPDGNPLLDHLVASWRARTSDRLGDESEEGWWALLVERFGLQAAQGRIEATMVGAMRDTVRTEADDLKHAMAVGHEIIRALFRLVDESKLAVS